MKENEESQNLNAEPSKEEFNKLFGMDPEVSLQSVNFATTENPYLNEYGHEDCNGEIEK
ncbi:hypothetical protein JOC75_003961 [Metabacillus crassostreae]|uniref:hypothetical protein n=1 Tax=Metabacillus crassostreae TaxID=929098 RepID=UPI00195A71AB|nr:hypothetical protein [Metabacillus crassostreae]MBM7605933.1 hypothetical protein [Metabacillus crassostreae]